MSGALPDSGIIYFQCLNSVHMIERLHYIVIFHHKQFPLLPVPIICKVLCVSDYNNVGVLKMF